MGVGGERSLPEFRIKAGTLHAGVRKANPQKWLLGLLSWSQSEQRADPEQTQRGPNANFQTADLTRPRADSKNPGSAFGILGCVRSVLNL